MRKAPYTTPKNDISSGSRQSFAWKSREHPANRGYGQRNSSGQVHPSNPGQNINGDDFLPFSSTPLSPYDRNSSWRSPRGSKNSWNSPRGGNNSWSTPRGGNNSWSSPYARNNSWNSSYERNSTPTSHYANRRSGLHAGRGGGNRSFDASPGFFHDNRSPRGNSHSSSPFNQQRVLIKNYHHKELEAMRKKHITEIINLASILEDPWTPIMSKISSSTEKEEIGT